MGTVCRFLTRATTPANTRPARFCVRPARRPPPPPLRLQPEKQRRLRSGTSDLPEPRHEVPLLGPLAVHAIQRAHRHLAEWDSLHRGRGLCRHLGKRQSHRDGLRPAAGANHQFLSGVPGRRWPVARRLLRRWRARTRGSGLFHFWLASDSWAWSFSVDAVVPAAPCLVVCPGLW